MKQRDALVVLGAVMLAVGVSAILLASSLASASPNRRIFFDPRNSPPPARTVIDTQRDPHPLESLALALGLDHPDGADLGGRGDVRSSVRLAVDEVVVRRWEHGLPYVYPGRYRSQRALEQPLGDIYLAGDYLGTRYTETAIATGTAAAEAIRRRLRI